jgi:hypothetical protein
VATGSHADRRGRADGRAAAGAAMSERS